MSEISFKNKFIELAKDNLIDKKELSELNNIAKNTNIKDKEIANFVINDLNRYKDTTKLTYNLNDPINRNQQISFTLSPTYSEEEIITGKNILEIISNISQSDNLPETNDDGNRCAVGSLVNAYLLMDGDFKNIAEKFSISKEFTYKNVHLLQEKIYDTANTDSRPGIESGYSYSYNPSSGKITSVKYSGELEQVAAKAGIEIKAITGSSVQDLYNRQEAVSEFMKNNPKGVFQVGVHLDTKTGDLYTPTTDKPQNHAILAFKKDNKYYLSDTGTTTNGANKGVREITKDQFSSFVERTGGTVNGLTMKK